MFAYCERISLPSLLLVTLSVIVLLLTSCSGSNIHSVLAWPHATCELPSIVCGCGVIRYDNRAGVTIYCISAPRHQHRGDPIGICNATLIWPLPLRSCLFIPLSTLYGYGTETICIVSSARPLSVFASRPVWFQIE